MAPKKSFSIVAIHRRLRRLCRIHGYCVPDKRLRWACHVTHIRKENKGGSCLPGLCDCLMWPGELPKEYKFKAMEMIRGYK